MNIEKNHENKEINDNVNNLKNICHCYAMRIEIYALIYKEFGATGNLPESQLTLVLIGVWTLPWRGLLAQK